MPMNFSLIAATAPVPVRNDTQWRGSTSLRLADDGLMDKTKSTKDDVRRAVAGCILPDRFRALYTRSGS